jgi:hypothetical protein
MRSKMVTRIKTDLETIKDIINSEIMMDYYVVLDDNDKLAVIEIYSKPQHSEPSIVLVNKLRYKKVTSDDIKTIKSLRMQKKTIKQISEKTGINQGTIKYYIYTIK